MTWPRRLPRRRGLVTAGWAALAGAATTVAAAAPAWADNCGTQADCFATAASFNATTAAIVGVAAAAAIVSDRPTVSDPASAQAEEAAAAPAASYLAALAAAPPVGSARPAGPADTPPTPAAAAAPAEAVPPRSVLDFGDPRQAAQWVRAAYDPVVARLSPASASALRQYTGYRFAPINDALRASVPPRADLRQDVALIDEALARQPLPEALVVYRGVSASGFPAGLGSLAVGTVHQDLAYTSASVGGPATDFRNSEVLLRLRVPAGTPALGVDAISDKGNEREVLLDRGLRYRVTSVTVATTEYGSDQYLVEGDVLPAAAVAEPGGAAARVRAPLALPPGLASQSRNQVLRSRSRARSQPGTGGRGGRWQAGEEWTRQLYRARPERHYPLAPVDDPDFPVTAPGGRFVDASAPVELLGGMTLAIEVKTYARFRTVTLASGQRVTQKVEVPLSPRIREQVNKDVQLRREDPTFDPRWVFVGAGPSPELRAYLARARIIFVEHG